MQVTKRRRNNKLIKTTAPCPKGQKLQQNAIINKVGGGRSIKGRIKKTRLGPNKEHNMMPNQNAISHLPEKSYKKPRHHAMLLILWTEQSQGG